VRTCTRKEPCRSWPDEQKVRHRRGKTKTDSQEKASHFSGARRVFIVCASSEAAARGKKKPLNSSENVKPPNLRDRGPFHTEEGHASFQAEEKRKGLAGLLKRKCLWRWGNILAVGAHQLPNLYRRGRGKMPRVIRGKLPEISKKGGGLILTILI